MKPELCWDLADVNTSPLAAAPRRPLLVGFDREGDSSTEKEVADPSRPECAQKLFMCPYACLFLFSLGGALPPSGLRSMDRVLSHLCDVAGENTCGRNPASPAQTAVLTSTLSPAVLDHPGPSVPCGEVGRVVDGSAQPQAWGRGVLAGF